MPGRRLVNLLCAARFPSSLGTGFFFAMTDKLRYTVQIRDGLRWRTVKAFPPSHFPQKSPYNQDQDYGYAVAARLAALIHLESKAAGKPCRVVLMPFNVVACRVPQ